MKVENRQFIQVMYTIQFCFAVIPLTPIALLIILLKRIELHCIVEIRAYWVETKPFQINNPRHHYQIA